MLYPIPYLYASQSPCSSFLLLYRSFLIWQVLSTFEQAHTDAGEPRLVFLKSLFYSFLMLCWSRLTFLLPTEPACAPQDQFWPYTHPESVLSLHFTFWSIHHPSFVPSKVIHSSSKCTPFINQFLFALTPKWGNSMSLCSQRHWEMVIIQSVKSPFATAFSEWSVEDNRSPSVSEEDNVGCISSSHAHPNSQSFFWGVYAP